jgi:hypothetical protein
MIPMKRIALTAIGLLFFSQAAGASPSWVLISFTTTAKDVPEVLAAADELMNSAAGKEFPGRLKRTERFGLGIRFQGSLIASRFVVRTGPS